MSYKYETIPFSRDFDYEMRVNKLGNLREKLKIDHNKLLLCAKDDIYQPIYN